MDPDATSSSPKSHDLPAKTDPNTARTFSQPCSSQSQSPLFKVIPTEIRTIILTHLLHSSQPLQYKPTPDEYAQSLGRKHMRDHKITNAYAPIPDPSLTFFSWSEWRGIAHPNFSFSPRVLGTCQALYAEGSRVLYSNTLLIAWTFELTWLNENLIPGPWHILAECDRIPGVNLDREHRYIPDPDGNSCEAERIQILDAIREAIDPNRPADPWSMHSRWDRTNVAMALTRMRKLEIRVKSRYSWNEGLFAERVDSGWRPFKCAVDLLLCALADVMVGKDVVVVLEGEREIDVELEGALKESKELKRCRSVEIRFDNGGEG